MNKKLLTAAVGAALAAGPMLGAQAADVKIFGKLQAQYDSIKIDGNCGTLADCETQSGIHDNGVMSRIGFDVSQDVGGGLKGVGRLEYTQVIANGVAPGAREQWVGLQGGFGTIALGRHQAPMKYIGGAAYDIFVATALQARGSGGAMWAPGTGWGAAGFVNNAIKYSSPNMGGFIVHAVAVPGDANQESNNGPGGGVDLNIGAKYGTKNWEVIAGVSRDTATDAQQATLDASGKALDDETVSRIGGKVSLAGFTILAQYENISNSLTSDGCSGGASYNGARANANASGLPIAGTAQCNTSITQGSDGKIWFVGLHYKLGNNTLVLQGGKTTSDALGPVAEKTAKNTTLGVVHFFAKQTRLFAGYQKVTTEGITVGTTADPDRTSWAVGLRQDF